MIAPAYCFGLISRLQNREEESRWSLADSLSEEMELTVQGDQSSYSAQERVLERRAPHGERTPEICSIQLNNEQCVHVRNLSETRKEPPERIGGDNARCSYSLGIWYLFLPTRLGNLKIHGHQVEYSEGSCFTS